MRKIKWLKWEDPLTPKTNNDIKNFEEQEQKDSFDQENDFIKHVRVISTPQGVIPLAEHGLSSNLYKLWVGHTNFDITDKIVSAIEKIKGVEILKVWTRYRFWIGIGNMFDVEKVQIEIENKLCHKSFPAKNLVVKSLLKAVKNKDVSWAICSNNKGVLETITGKNDLDVKKEVLKNNLYVIKCSWHFN
jgi:hypothetical protein